MRSHTKIRLKARNKTWRVLTITLCEWMGVLNVVTFNENKTTAGNNLRFLLGAGHGYEVNGHNNNSVIKKTFKRNKSKWFVPENCVTRLV